MITISIELSMITRTFLRMILAQPKRTTINNDARFTVAKNVVFVGAKKPVVDEPVSQKHGPDADVLSLIETFQQNS